MAKKKATAVLLQERLDELEKRLSALEKGVVLRDDTGTERGWLVMTQDGGTVLALFDKNKIPRILLGAAATGQPSLTLNDRNGKLRLSLAVTEEGPRLQFLDPNESVIAQLPAD